MAADTPIRTIACGYDNHSKCTRRDTRCECACHPWARPDMVQQKKADDREAAHQAVKAFDHGPTVENTDAAISALLNYRTWLSA